MLASWDKGKPCKELVFNYEGFNPLRGTRNVKILH